MPIFERKKAKPEAKKVSEIVFGMLANNMSEDRIIQTLLQSGVSKTEAQTILTGAKKQYKDYVGSRLDAFVDKLLEQKKQEITRHIESEIKTAKEEVFLQSDLKFMEQKQYVDKRVESLRKEVDSLKNDIYSLRVDADAKMGYIKSEVEGLRFKGAPRILLSVLMMLAGVLLIAFFSLTMKDILLVELALEQNLPYIGFYILFIFVGLILLKLGTDIYFEKAKKHVGVGLDWMQEKDKEKKK